jgi:hypothetical protein
VLKGEGGMVTPASFGQSRMEVLDCVLRDMVWIFSVDWGAS